MPTITIFGGSHLKEGDVDYERGRVLGRKLAEAGYVVCNGGYGGIMEATARGAKEGGGKTIGITTRDFGGPPNPWIDREIKTEKWNERLFKLIERGDGYVLFEGGTGTLVELFVVWEMSNKKFLAKPIIVLGRRIEYLIYEVCKFPAVINHANFFFKHAPEEVVKLLGERIGKQTSRF